MLALTEPPDALSVSVLFEILKIPTEPPSEAALGGKHHAERA